MREQLPAIVLDGYKSAIEIRHDSQSFQSKVRMNHTDLGKSSRDQSGVSTGGYDVNFLARKLLRSNLGEDFANQSAITEHGPR